MATYTRNNAWNKGGDFTNLDLLWYAKGVGKMMSRALNDPASWWFYAAMHGEYANPNTAWYPKPPAFPAWKFIKPGPAVPITPLPVSGNQNLYWNQCQHQSWYFLPWHRGYLLALEAQLRKDIVSLNGPKTWALPYWNYFGGTNGSQFQMPPAFAAKKLPDNSANPLFVTMRYGPDGVGNIFIPTAAGKAAHPGDPNFGRGEVTTNSMNEPVFTPNSQVNPGFGGPETGFAHGGGTSGKLEGNPHNLVHVYTGYYGPLIAPLFGLMSDPGTAALDPIFYLHHANIDRMWAVWNASGHPNPTKSSWLKGPTTRKFVMPGTNGQPWYYTPDQMKDLAKLDYTYQELKALALPKVDALPQRLALLGAQGPAATPAAAKPAAAPAKPKKTELLGASEQSFKIKGRVSRASVKLDQKVRQKTVRSLAAVAESVQDAVPDNVYLKVENVRGTFDATVLSVYVNLPEGAKPRDNPQYLAGNVALFGLRMASAKDGKHAGEGLTFVLNITPVIDALHLSHSLDVDSLHVSVIPADELPDEADITVGRISLYREGL